MHKRVNRGSSLKRYPEDTVVLLCTHSKSVQTWLDHLPWFQGVFTDMGHYQVVAKGSDWFSLFKAGICATRCRWESQGTSRLRYLSASLGETCLITQVKWCPRLLCYSLCFLPQADFLQYMLLSWFTSLFQPQSNRLKNYRLRLLKLQSKIDLFILIFLYIGPHYVGQV